MKKIERKCCSCASVKDRSEMIRITNSKGTLEINPDSKMLGRSVYVCKKPDCIKAMIKKKRIKTALKFSDTEQIELIEKKLSDFI